MPQTYSPPTFSPKENLKGGLFIAIAMAAFLFNDAIIKHLTSSVPFGQIMLVRGLFMIVIILIVARATGAMRPIRTFKNKHLSWRVFGECIATISYLAAIVHVPISNATSILQALPLTVTLGAAWFLGESVGWRRWTAIMIGFIGVLMIIQPGMVGFNSWSLLVLVTIAGATLRDLSTRAMDKSIPALFAAIATSIAISILGLILTLRTGWQPMVTKDLMLCFLAASIVTVAYFFIVEGMRTGETAFVTPFRYTILIWALLVGYFFFGEVPNLLMLIGCAIVVAMGLFTVYRERKLSKKVS